MKDSTQLIIAFFIILGVTVVLFAFALIQGNLSSIENILGILLAFALGMMMTEYVRVRNDEKRTNDIIQDLLTETKEIIEKGSAEGFVKLHSATWSFIKSTGMPTRVKSDLRKKILEVFQNLEIYNEDVQRYEDYSIQPKCDDDVLSGFKLTIDESKILLLSLCEKVIELAKTQGYIVS
ncbi:MAG: hypothetical protein ACFFE6_10680 [Candidatus Thorarchaeota archaeon]